MSHLNVCKIVRNDSGTLLICFNMSTADNIEFEVKNIIFINTFLKTLISFAIDETLGITISNQSSELETHYDKLKTTEGLKLPNKESSSRRMIYIATVQILVPKDLSVTGRYY